MPSSDIAAIAVSIVVPVRNEAENIAPVIAEIAAALDGRWNYEIIYVNDGSTDATPERLASAMKSRRNLRQIRHAASSGQSAAVRSGVRVAHGAIVATLDGDGQNNPAFLPALISAIEQGGERTGLAAGQRVGRKDTGFKKMQSRIANSVRNAILHDGTRDTGCGLKAFRREVFLALPYFDGLASVPAGAGAPRGIRHRLCRCDRPSEAFRRVELWLFRPAMDRNHGSRGGVVADPPQEADACRDRGEVMLIQYGQALNNYFYDYFVAKFDFWLAFGLVAQLAFAARFLVQWIASERAGKASCRSHSIRN